MLTGGSGADRRATILVAVATVCCAAAFAWRAWVAEDPHITMRTVQHFVSGFGLRWNLDERVQIFTHPLWLFLIAPFYAVTREIHTTLTVLGLACSTGAVLLLAHRYRTRPWLLLLAVLAPCLLSGSITLYATSGFENPLASLLVVAFAVSALRSPSEEVPWGRLAFIAALGVTNRLDHALLYAPFFLFVIARAPGQVRWGALAAGSAPLLAWLAFSTFYFGFPLPNTAYAKLAPEIPRSLFLERGLAYAVDLVARDRVAATALLLCVAAAAFHGWRLRRSGDARAAALAGLGSGVALYGGYVLWVGGDFLSGRFWSVPAWLAIFVCAESSAEAFAWLRHASRPAQGALAAAAAGWLVLLPPLAAHVNAEPPRHRRILPLAIARYSLDGHKGWKMTRWAVAFREHGAKALRRAERTGEPAQVLEIVGLAGLAAGPSVRVVDANALGDALLARLPPLETREFKIGHLTRAIPKGYLAARNTGSTAEMHPALARYYEQLRLVTSGPLLAEGRLAAIWHLNVGTYDYLLDDYLRSLEARR